ncbi:MAG TPA: amino acid permease [Gemmatimonadales bacterium]|nr:amino acid permease [Gemmatimonadales bacterium]
MQPQQGTTPGEDRWGSRLPRSLGLFSAIALVIGSTIGSGIFRVPARIADQVPAALPMLSVWIVGGALALCGALTYAELGGLFPNSGGVYRWVKEGHGNLAGFLYGWSELVVIRASSLGAISTVFAEYLLRVIHGRAPADGSLSVHLVAAGVIAVMAALNYVGVRWASVVVNLTSAGKFGALVLIFLGAYLIGDGSFANFTQVEGPVTAGAFGLSLIAVMWAYDGFADLARVGGEIRDPERNLPRALVIGTVAIIGVYLAANAAYLYLIPVAQMRTSTLVAADAAQLLVGRVGVGLVSLAVMVSTLGAVASVMFTSPRIFFAMADDGLFFRSLARVHPRFQTPSRSIVLTAGMAVLFVLFLDFEALSDTFVLATWPFYALAAASVFVLRARAPELRRPVRVVGYPVVPALFILAATAMIVNALARDADRALLAFGLIVSGLPAYALWRRFGGP